MACTASWPLLLIAQIHSLDLVSDKLLLRVIPALHTIQFRRQAVVADSVQDGTRAWLGQHVLCARSPSWTPSLEAPTTPSSCVRTGVLELPRNTCCTGFAPTPTGVPVQAHR